MGLGGALPVILVRISSLCLSLLDNRGLLDERVAASVNEGDT